MLKTIEAKTKIGNKVIVELGEYCDKAQISGIKIPHQSIDAHCYGGISRVSKFQKNLPPHVELGDPYIHITWLTDGKLTESNVIFSVESAELISAELAKLQVALDALIPNHKNCWDLWKGERLMIESADQWGVSIVPAVPCPPESRAQWREPDYIFYSSQLHHLKLDNLDWRDMPQRKSDGSFPGCSNMVWWVTDEEARALVALDEARAEAKRNQPKPEPITYGPGYCYSCESYCHGDCGDYAPTYTTKIMVRRANEAVREDNYGIEDGE